MTWYNGSDGYAVVDPSGASGTAPATPPAQNPAPMPAVEEEEEEMVVESVPEETPMPAAEKPPKEKGPLARWMDYMNNQS